jgi:hypothetical protein
MRHFTIADRTDRKIFKAIASIDDVVSSLKPRADRLTLPEVQELKNILTALRVLRAERNARRMNADHNKEFGK